MTMKSAFIAFALLFGLSVGGAALLPSGSAHAQTWSNPNSGGGAG
jgi:hypothetical protein